MRFYSCHQKNQFRKKGITIFNTDWDISIPISGTISASKIAAGTISASKIAAGTISAERIVVSDDAMTFFDDKGILRAKMGKF